MPEAEASFAGMTLESTQEEQAEEEREEAELGVEEGEEELQVEVDIIEVEVEGEQSADMVGYVADLGSSFLALSYHRKAISIVSYSMRQLRLV